ncbi:MAG: phosphate acyltransferase PlsX [Chloroflexi bacterium]|nr:phosphate acyltransferase PlsX [Chloroflexota bacterium]
MRIALDAMGSDNHPVPDVEGAVLASKTYGVTVVLVGDQSTIKRELQKHDTIGLPLEIVHANQVVDMDDKPAQVTREKPESSIHVGMGLVEDGQADAFVSMGNTGAVLAIATLQKLKRIRGVHRPALSSIVPFVGKHVILADIGANVDCKAEWLHQFAQMGSIYARQALHYANPKIALLSNGEEEGKGYSLIHETIPLLLADDSLHYVGNIEPKEVVHGGADVVISDGFVGNIFVKSLEAMGMALFDGIKGEIMATQRGKLGGLLLKPTFRSVYKKFDPFEIGGAPLLGINGVVIIGHGRSNAKAIQNAIRQAKFAVEGDVVEAIKDGINNRSV